MQRRLAALLVLPFALVAGVAAPAAAQAADGLTATVTVVPTSTTPGGTAQATAVFQPPTTPQPMQLTIELNGFASGTASFAPPPSAVGALTGCVLRLNNMRVRCDWLSGTGGEQTLTVTINVAAGAAAPQQGNVQAFASPSGTTLILRASTPLNILPAATTVPTTTTIAPTEPTTAPTTPTSATSAPTSAVVAPTSAAAATTDPGDLPATGGSDASALIALVVLALGAFLLIIARKFRET